ncbi:hypothetical protein EDEG_01655 [Edhazardia aedis USNM 41457]|uniref:DNA replication complex GINS protein SLD5 n=1 Tax=Edhazardia aedis (strain USNM 41457) TaxID=1003232 RepID=J9D9C3_EDHAE|nr:hypothetical protein EDEG_01655 [Edhazardia aedis USNM 41457]|eukprot:EJW04079.1 hypothetical protein EDEG_01655 [Edhazardia aedis USNM 41457]
MDTKTNDLIQELIQTYTNEYNTKLLLPYNRKLASQIIPIIKAQNDYIKKLESTNINKLYLSIYQLEYERISYFLNSYLRTRLVKINKEHEFCDKNLLSDYELKFLESINVFELNGFLKDSKEMFCSDRNDKFKNEYVGFYVICDRKSVVIDGNPLDINYGDVYVSLLSDVYDLLINKDIVLI